MCVFYSDIVQLQHSNKLSRVERTMDEASSAIADVA